MNRSERFIARIMFQLKVHQSDGQEYENLFSKVMVKHNSNFKLVKPYGNVGDRKNDGFDQEKGIYYQVFAPENIDKSRTIIDAAKKLKEDFSGLKSYWDSICKITEFYYVVNDKYKGIPAPVHKEVMELRTENPGVFCDTFCSNNLESIFMDLVADDIIDIVGIIPNEEIGFLNFDILHQAVEYLINSESDVFLDSLTNSPDFNEKIEFNNLNPFCANMLTVASYQIGDLESYFNSTGEFVKNELKNRFISLYKQSIEKISITNDNYADKRFMYILNNASPSDKKAVKDAVLVLMSYYFEACDIFESPIKAELK